MNIKPHPNRLFNLSLCGSLMISKSKFASGKTKAGRNSFNEFRLVKAQRLCIPSQRAFAYTCCQFFPSKCFRNVVFLQLTQILNPWHILNAVVSYWWCVVGSHKHIKGSRKSPDDSAKDSFTFVLRHRIQYLHIKCESPTDGWTDTFHFFVSIPPFLDRETPPQQRLWDARQSRIHNYHNTVLDKWTLTCLNHNKLIVPHKVSILTAPQTHTTPILSTHKKSVDFPALEKSGKLICYIWQQRMTGEQSRYYCKIFQRSARIISLQIMSVLYM